MWCMKCGYFQLRKVVSFAEHIYTNNPIELPFEKSFFNFVLPLLGGLAVD